jgi:hypothetical protein
MADFCKECFKKSVAVPSDGITDDILIMSEYTTLCEGCLKWKPVVMGLSIDITDKVEVKIVGKDIYSKNRW